MPKKERPIHFVRYPSIERCSFCGSESHRYRGKKLISGGTDKVYICHECVELYCDILAQEGKKDEGSKQMNNERVPPLPR